MRLVAEKVDAADERQWAGARREAGARVREQAEEVEGKERDDEPC